MPQPIWPYIAPSYKNSPLPVVLYDPVRIWAAMRASKSVQAILPEQFVSQAALAQLSF